MTSAVTLEHLCKPLNVDLNEREQLDRLNDLNSDIEDLNSEIEDIKDELKDALTRFKDLLEYIVEPDTSFDDVKSSAEKLLKYNMFWHIE